MRTLTANTIAQKNGTSIRPINILRVDFGGAVGTRYYSDVTLGSGTGLSALNAESRVVSWGNISRSVAEQKPSPTGSVSVSLRDEDKALKTIAEQIAVQSKPAYIYQYFNGLVEGDLVPIMRGTVDSPLKWSQGNAEFQLDLVDIGVHYSQDIGTELDRDDFPYLLDDDEGLIIPFIYGSGVRRVKGLNTCGGSITKLMARCGISDAELFVENAERFPQGSAIVIRIDQELIAGSFSGNTFTITGRGQTVKSGTVTSEGDTLSFVDSTMALTDDYYDKYKLVVASEDPDTDRFVTGYNAATKTLSYVPVYYDGITPKTLSVGTAYSIQTEVSTHQMGAPVFLHGTAYKFLLADHPCASVDKVEVHGKVTRWKTISEVTPSQEVSYTYEGWFDVPSGQYVVNKNDTSVYGVSHPVTSITFYRHPREIFWGMDSLDVYATVSGVDDAGDGSGSALTDPSDIIYALLRDKCGVPEANLDATSFAQASTEGTQYLTYNVKITEKQDGVALAENLAFAARCALVWEDDKAKLLFLKDKMSTAVATIDSTHLIPGSVTISHSSIEQVFTEIRFKFTKFDVEGNEVEKELIVRDSDAITLYGKKVKNIDLSFHNVQKSAEDVASFWLKKWKDPREIVELAVYLTHLELERLDVVELDYTDLFASGQTGRVMGIEHHPGSGVQSDMDNISLTIELPRVPGCSGNCETDCETGGETGCLFTCQATAQTCWACETSCQSQAQLAPDANNAQRRSPVDDVTHSFDGTNDSDEHIPQYSIVDTSKDTDLGSEYPQVHVDTPSDETTRTGIAQEPSDPDGSVTVQVGGRGKMRVSDYANQATGARVSSRSGKLYGEPICDGEWRITGPVAPSVQPVDPVSGVGLVHVEYDPLPGRIVVDNAASEAIPRGGLVWIPRYKSNGMAADGWQALYPGVSRLAIAAAEIPVGAQGPAWPANSGYHMVLAEDYADLAVGQRLGAQAFSWYATACEIGPLEVRGFIASSQQPSGLPEGVGLVIVENHGRRGEALIVVDEDNEPHLIHTIVASSPWLLAHSTNGHRVYATVDETFANPQFVMSWPAILMVDADLTGMLCNTLIGDKSLKITDGMKSWNTTDPASVTWLMPDLYVELDIGDDVALAPPVTRLATNELRIASGLLVQWLHDGVMLLGQPSDEVSEQFTSDLHAFFSDDGED